MRWTAPRVHTICVLPWSFCVSSTYGYGHRGQIHRRKSACKNPYWWILPQIYRGVKSDPCECTLTAVVGTLRSRLQIMCFLCNLWNSHFTTQLFYMSVQMANVNRKHLLQYCSYACLEKQIVYNVCINHRNVFIYRMCVAGNAKLLTWICVSRFG